ncbi:hypothetical protein DPX16_14398 [Anabarilius grahami]|uniref:Uncharacterized protein n=1 Tax=Anabarilius grahami TaxID=495550 RepID=A0A3N0XM11_ANAGA|nr:hypothetical protein DPX16_14398 [Anabarilius grahami]
MDLINWSLNAIDTIFSTRSLGSGEPDCPAGTFAAGYTMDAWERWRVVCLAALSVEDIEDIYLFGTMITGLLLIGLGFALVYREIRKTVTAVQNPTRLLVMIEAVGRAVSIETGTINRKMDNIMENLTALQSCLMNLIANAVRKAASHTGLAGWMSRSLAAAWGKGDVRDAVPHGGSTNARQQSLHSFPIWRGQIRITYIG